MKVFQLVLHLILFSILSMNALAQEELYPTGPYSTERDYLREKYAKTTHVSREESIGLVRGVELRIDDGIKDGCWTNVSGVAARIRAELERSNIAVYDERLAYASVFYPLLILDTSGYRLSNDTCIGRAELALIYPTDSETGNLHQKGYVLEVAGIVRLWSIGFIANSSDNLNDQITDIAQQSMDTLIADVLSKRRSDTVASALEKWPANPPPTEVEFAELLESRKREQENK